MTRSGIRGWQLHCRWQQSRKVRWLQGKPAGGHRLPGKGLRLDSGKMPEGRLKLGASVNDPMPEREPVGEFADCERPITGLRQGADRITEQSPSNPMRSSLGPRGRGDDQTVPGSNGDVEGRSDHKLEKPSGFQKLELGDDSIRGNHERNEDHQTLPEPQTLRHTRVQLCDSR